MILLNIFLLWAFFLPKNVKTCIFIWKRLDNMLLMTSYLVTIAIDCLQTLQKCVSRIKKKYWRRHEPTLNILFKLEENLKGGGIHAPFTSEGNWDRGLVYYNRSQTENILPLCCNMTWRDWLIKQMWRSIHCLNRGLKSDFVLITGIALTLKTL